MRTGDIITQREVDYIEALQALDEWIRDLVKQGRIGESSIGLDEFEALKACLNAVKQADESVYDEDGELIEDE